MPGTPFLRSAKLFALLLAVAAVASCGGAMANAISTASATTSSSSAGGASVSPAAVSFGSVLVNTTAQQTLTITNNSNHSVNLRNVSLSGQGFKMSGWNGATTLGAHSAMSLALTFSPTSAQSYSGTVLVSCKNQADQAIALSGTGTAAAPVQTVGVVISPASAAIQTSMKQQFTSSVTGTTNTAVTWSVNGTPGGNSTAGSISSTGLYAAPSVVPTGGTVTITATSVADPAKSARAVVSLSASALPVTVSISPAIATVEAGKSQQFTAAVQGTTSTGVTWQVSGVNGGNSTVGTINTAGLYTAPAIAPSGAVSVTARSAYDATASATASVTITAAPTTPSANDRYVSPTGSDANDGTYGHPWQTLTKANSMAKPGYVVHVAPGTYTFYPSLKLTTAGTSTAGITYVSDVKWAAKLVSSGSTGSPDWNTAVSVSGNYVTVRGFEIYSMNSSTLMGGLLLGGSYQTADSNKVHDIPAPGPSGVGGCGICVSLWNPRTMTYGTGNQVIGNTVFNIGFADPAGHRTHGIYFQNHNGYVANNVVHHVLGGWGIKLGHAIYNVKAVNNTVFSNNYGGFDIDGSAADNGGTKPDYIYVANNIVYNNGIAPGAAGYGIQEYSDSTGLGPNCSYVNNLVYNNKPGNWLLKATGGTGSGTISTAPGFVSWQADGSGDYHLAASSPAVNNGNGTSAPKNDAEGRARPAGGNWDLGAYEYGAPSVAWPY